MKAIGGFFELECPRDRGGYHPDALALTNGRACLRHALGAINPRRALVPFYTCDAMLEPFEALGIPVRFYGLNDRLAPHGAVGELAADDVLVYVNYFGLLGDEARDLARSLGDRLIVDNTQAFFERGYPGAWSFNSARKSFGVPDGAYMYAPRPIEPVDTRNDAPAWDHLIGRLMAHQDSAYRAFMAAESRQTSQVQAMSLGAERLLAGIDYEDVRERRRRNYALYESALGPHNTLRVSLSPDATPFCYPFLPAREVSRARLHAQQIFVPSFWPDCLARDPMADRSAGPSFDFERSLATRLLPLPLDHRYAGAEIARVVSAVREGLEA